MLPSSFLTTSLLLYLLLITNIIPVSNTLMYTTILSAGSLKKVKFDLHCSTADINIFMKALISPKVKYFASILGLSTT